MIKTTAKSPKRGLSLNQDKNSNNDINVVYKELEEILQQNTPLQGSLDKGRNNEKIKYGRVNEDQFQTLKFDSSRKLQNNDRVD